MNLHAIKARLDRALSRSGKLSRNLLNLLDRHGLWRRSGILAAVEALAADGDGTRGQCGLAVEEGGHGGATDVPQLTVDEAAFGVHGVGDAFPAGDLAGGEDAWAAWVTAAVGMGNQLVVFSWL